MIFSLAMFAYHELIYHYRFLVVNRHLKEVWRQYMVNFHIQKVKYFVALPEVTKVTTSHQLQDNIYIYISTAWELTSKKEPVYTGCH